MAHLECRPSKVNLVCMSIFLKVCFFHQSQRESVFLLRYMHVWWLAPHKDLLHQRLQNRVDSFWPIQSNCEVKPSQCLILEVKSNKTIKLWVSILAVRLYRVLQDLNILTICILPSPSGPLCAGRSSQAAAEKRSTEVTRPQVPEQLNFQCYHPMLSPLTVFHKLRIAFARRVLSSISCFCFIVVLLTQIEFSLCGSEKNWARNCTTINPTATQRGLGI